jgi:AbrB family looped-hinge helix DNA binding protein
MKVTTLTSKGQVTIPKHIRDALQLKGGDKIAFRLGPDGVRLMPQTLKARDLFGILERPGKRKALSVEQMDTAVERSFKRRRK